MILCNFFSDRGTVTRFGSGLWLTSYPRRAGSGDTLGDIAGAPTPPQGVPSLPAKNKKAQIYKNPVDSKCKLWYSKRNRAEPWRCDSIRSGPTCSETTNTEVVRCHL